MKAAASLATAISAIVAVITLFFAVVDNARRVRETQLREWQKVVVYAFLEKSQHRGAAFEQIRSAYREEAQAYALLDVPKEAISEQALQRILLELVSDHAIVLGPARTYQAAFAPPFPVSMIMREEKMSQVGDAIMALVTAEGCRYKVNQIRTKLSERFKFEPGEFEGIFASMTSDRFLEVNRQGFVCSTTTR